MKPKDNTTDFTACYHVCCLHSYCGCCELCQLANVADRRIDAKLPVATPIANPLLMQQMAQMAQIQMQQVMMQQAALTTPNPLAQPAMHAPMGTA